MEGREQSSGDCVRALEVGTRWQTSDEEVNDDDEVNAADMCRRTVAHATTDKTSLSMRPLPLDLVVTFLGGNNVGKKRTSTTFELIHFLTFATSGRVRYYTISTFPKPWRRCR